MDIGDVENLRAKLMYLPEDIRHKIYEAFNVLASDIVADAKGFAPVRTGRLRESVYGHVSRDLVLKVGASAPYAKFVEFGTSRMAPRAFLSTALYVNLPKLIMLTREALRLALIEMRKWGR